MGHRVAGLGAPYQYTPYRHARHVTALRKCTGYDLLTGVAGGSSCPAVQVCWPAKTRLNPVCRLLQIGLPTCASSSASPALVDHSKLGTAAEAHHPLLYVRVHEQRGMLAKWVEPSRSECRWVEAFWAQKWAERGQFDPLPAQFGPTHAQAGGAANEVGPKWAHPPARAPRPRAGRPVLHSLNLTLLRYSSIRTHNKSGLSKLEWPGSRHLRHGQAGRG